MTAIKKGQSPEEMGDPSIPLGTLPIKSGTTPIRMATVPISLQESLTR